MVPGDHLETDAEGASASASDSQSASASASDSQSASASQSESESASHWMRWHRPYEDPSSMLSRRLRAVQSRVSAALDTYPESPDPESPELQAPIRMVSLCAGQGRDVIDVVATHPRGPEVSALLVELDPALAAFARARAVAAGPAVAERIRVVEGDASQCHWYADAVPADIVLVCGVFGNISAADITRTIQAMRGFCAPGGHVVWTRHRRPPDLTPAIRADFAAAGFTELAFEASEDSFMTVGHHRLDGPTAPFDPGQVLFDFVGDGHNPV